MEQRTFEAQFRSFFSIAYEDGLDYLEREFNLSVDRKLNKYGDEYLNDDDTDFAALTVDETRRREAFKEGVELRISDDYDTEARRLAIKYAEQYLIACIQGVIFSITDDRRSQKAFGIDFFKTLLAIAKSEIREPSQEKELAKIEGILKEIEKKFLFAFITIEIKEISQDLEYLLDIESVMDLFSRLDLVQEFLKKLENSGFDIQALQFEASEASVLRQKINSKLGIPISNTDTTPHANLEAIKNTLQEGSVSDDFSELKAALDQSSQNEKRDNVKMEKFERSVNVAKQALNEGGLAKILSDDLVNLAFLSFIRFDFSDLEEEKKTEVLSLCERRIQMAIRKIREKSFQDLSDFYHQLYEVLYVAIVEFRSMEKRIGASESDPERYYRQLPELKRIMTGSNIDHLLDRPSADLDTYELGQVGKLVEVGRIVQESVLDTILKRRGEHFVDPKRVDQLEVYMIEALIKLIETNPTKNGYLLKKLKEVVHGNFALGRYIEKINDLTKLTEGTI